MNSSRLTGTPAVRVDVLYMPTDGPIWTLTLTGPTHRVETTGPDLERLRDQAIDELTALVAPLRFTCAVGAADSQFPGPVRCAGWTEKGVA